jgi:predicted secreted protein
MSKVNNPKHIEHTSKVFDTKSNNNGSYKLLLLAISVASLLAISISSVPTSSNIAYAQTSTAAGKTGTITSEQKDQAGTWKLSGTWDFNNLNSNSPTFTSTFSMAKLDGSAMHKHTINDFKLTENPTKTSTGTTYTGTATVSMKEGPVSNVPISITLSDNGNVSIMIDPKTTNNHFGNTPIEGKVTTT